MADNLQSPNLQSPKWDTYLIPVPKLASWVGCSEAEAVSKGAGRPGFAAQAAPFDTRSTLFRATQAASWELPEPDEGFTEGMLSQILPKNWNAPVVK